MMTVFMMMMKKTRVIRVHRSSMKKESKKVKWMLKAIVLDENERRDFVE